MESFNQALHEATGISTGHDRLQNAACVAADKRGNILHSVASGTYAPLHRPDDGFRPFTADTVCSIASMTKLMTTVAALQCVEKKLIGLDDDVAQRWLPEFKDVQVLEKMVDDGNGGEEPRLRPARGKMTLRNLLTHSSGLSYEFMHPRLFLWREWDSARRRGTKTHADRTEVSRAFLVPLVFDPDTRWSYGYGIDWAGVIVEHISNMTLEQYMRRHLWQPLGMHDTTFRPGEHAHLADRMCGKTERDGEGNLSVSDGDAQTQGFGVIRDMPGGGVFSTANDYVKLLVSLLRNDERLLRKQTVDYMFQPQLKDPSHLRAMHASPESFGLAGNIPPGVKVDFGLGGILNQEMLPTGRSAGGMQWGGYPNLFWWINRTDGICGCYFSQLVPPGDPASFDMYKKFETAINATFKKDAVKL